MSSRERLLAVIGGEIPDRVPATIHQWQPYHLKNTMHMDDDIDAFQAVGLDAVTYPLPTSYRSCSDEWKVNETVEDKGDGMREIKTVIQHEIIHDIDPNIAISYHTCGGMMQLLDLIPRNGCHFSETLSPVGCGGDIRDGVDEETVKVLLGSNVKLMGGINQIQVLTSGGREDIYGEVERAFQGYGENGGYIMMTSDHFFHTSKENLVHYADAVKEICHYS